MLLQAQLKQMNNHIFGKHFSVECLTVGGEKRIWCEKSVIFFFLGFNPSRGEGNQ